MNTLVRFAVVGACTTGLDLVLFNSFLLLCLSTVGSHALSTSIILPLSFLLQRRAFRSGIDPLRQAMRFALVTVVGAYGVQILVLQGAMAVLGGASIGPANLAKLAAMTVGIAWNFVLFRWFVFRSTGPAWTDQTSRKAASSAGDGRANARFAVPVGEGRNLLSR